MKVVEIKNGIKNTSFTVKNKASNMAMTVSLFISIHKLKCPMILNYRYYIVYLGVCKGVESFGKQ